MFILISVLFSLPFSWFSCSSFVRASVIVLPFRNCSNFFVFCSKYLLLLAITSSSTFLIFSKSLSSKCSRFCSASCSSIVSIP